MGGGPACGVEVDDLAAGVNPGVGAPRAVNGDRLATLLRESVLEDALDGAAVGEDLEPCEVGAVVSDRQSAAGRGFEGGGGDGDAQPSRSMSLQMGAASPRLTPTRMMRV